MLDKFLVGHFIKIITMKVKDKPTFTKSAPVKTKAKLTLRFIKGYPCAVT